MLKSAGYMLLLLLHFYQDIIFKRMRVAFLVFCLFLLLLFSFASEFNPQTMQEIPSSIGTIGTGYFINNPLKSDAVCLDGSSPLYYHIPGVDSGSKKWFFYFEAGGWCSSLADCFSRSQTNMGSTLRDSMWSHFDDGYFSNIESLNPLMFNWNKVFIRCCDGGSFSGNNVSFYQDHKLYFKGRKILDAIFEDLLLNRDLNVATDAVVSGCSAGGLTSILQVDHIRDMLPPETKIVAMPDSGFFMDYEGEVVNYHSFMKFAFENMNSREGVNKKCVDYYGLNEDWKCFFAEHTLPFVESPVFILQPKYDSWQIQEILGKYDATSVQNFGNEFMRRVRDSFLTFEKNSGFIDSCNHHCGSFWNNLHINNMTQSQAFYLWYTGSEKQAYIHDTDFPCFNCCN